MFKKFLVISSYAPPAIGGAPLMMYNLLSQFPPNTFSILTSQSGINQARSDKSRWLKVQYFFFDTPALTTTTDRNPNFSQTIKRLLKKIWFVAFIGKCSVLLYSVINIILIGLKITRNKNIRLLIAYSDYGPALLATFFLNKLTKIPYYLYFFDLYNGNGLSAPFSTIARFFEPLLFRNAQHIFLMNEHLQSHYNEKYLKESTVIYNSICSQEYSLNSSNYIINSKTARIVYTGTIYWAQLDAIQNLIKALNEIQTIDIQLILYSPHDKAYLNSVGLFESKKILFRSGGHEEMRFVQRSANILFVALGFNTRYPLLINTSSPGKTYEYMASGRPILIHAPKKSYIAQYARKYNFAAVVDEDNYKLLKKEVLELINNPVYVEKLVSNAKKQLFQNHDAEKNFKKFSRFFKKQ